MQRSGFRHDTALIIILSFVMVRGFVVTICKSAVFLPALFIFLSGIPVKGSFFPGIFLRLLSAASILKRSYGNTPASIVTTN